MSYPSVYPTGTTIYDPDRCFNGYTLYQAKEHGALLIDMNGGEVNLWQGLDGSPQRLLPGGQVMGHLGQRPSLFASMEWTDLVQVDWNGQIVWKFDHFEYIEDPGEEPGWQARIHGDYQRQGCPVGYYVPGQEPLVEGGKTLILGHQNVRNKKISDKMLIDDHIYEVDWAGNIVWEWSCNEHFDELGFSEAAKNALYRDPNVRFSGVGGAGDWMHFNNMAVLGPNKWYDAGDERFHPDNIIFDGRESSLSGIIDRASGKIVWRLGPEYDIYSELGAVIGQHHVHMIPRGLPGEGNILIFDNGGWAGYGNTSVNSPRGSHIYRRDYTRGLEIDPTTLKIVWQCTPSEMGLLLPQTGFKFYSPFVSSVQRLPNANTLITFGAAGRMIEVTPDYQIVWEYISPYFGKGALPFNMVYRAYRYPYDYVPQVEKPQETPVVKLDISSFRVPGAKPSGAQKVTQVAGVRPYEAADNFCMATEEENKKLGR